MSWSLVHIGDCVEKVASWNPLKSESDAPFFYIDLSSVDKDKKEVDKSNVSKLFPSEAPSRARQLVKSGDVLVSTVRPNLNGVALVSGEYEGATASTGYCILRPEGNRLDGKYLYYWVRSRAFVTDMMKKVTGANYPAVSDKIIKESKIPLPPLTEQKRIAAILDKADAIRRKRQQAIQLADEFLRAVFLDMFGDPVTNPKGFELRVLSDFYIDYKTGTKCGPFGSALKKEEYTEYGIPVWNMDNINLNGDFTDYPSLWVSEQKFNELGAYSVRQGDVIISRAGTVGKMGVVRSQSEQSLISTNLIRVRFGEELLPEYFVALMTYCKGRVGRLKTGPDGAFTHMNTGILNTLEFPYPPVELQKKYLEIRNKVMEMVDDENSSSDQCTVAFRSISQRAFNGSL